MNVQSKYFIGIGMMACLALGCDNDDDDDNNAMSGQDRDFVRMASISNTAEIQAGQLAASKATDASIKMFGQMMVNDHTAALNDLKSVAGDLGLAVADTVDAEHRALKAQLDTLSGYAFDSV